MNKRTTYFKLWFLVFSFFLSLATFAQEDGALSIDEFKKQTAVQGKIILVYFHADWCAPCKKSDPIIEQIEAEESTDKVVILKVDADQSKELTKQMEVNTFPYFMLYKNGTVVWSNDGLVSKQEIKNKLDIFK